MGVDLVILITHRKRTGPSDSQTAVKENSLKFVAAQHLTQVSSTF